MAEQGIDFGPSVAARPVSATGSAACLLVGAACFVISAAGPRWGDGGDPGVLRGRDVVVVFDLSKSMLADDIADPEHKTRVSAARKMLSDWLAKLAARSAGHRLALVAFAGKSAVLCPLTSDYAHLAHLVEDLDPEVLPADLIPRTDDEVLSGTRIGQALRRAVAAHDPNFPGYQDIILFSDGHDPIDDGEYDLGVLVANAAKIPVSCVGVGRPNPANRPEDDALVSVNDELFSTRLMDGVLRDISRRTRGDYFEAGNMIADVDGWFRRSVEPKSSREVDADLFPQPRDRSAWPLALGVLCLTLAGLLGRARPRLPVRLVPGLALFVASALIAAGPPAPDLRPAEAALQAEQWTLAEDLLSKAQPATGDPGAVAFGRGVAAFHRNEFREAELLFRRVLGDAAIPGSRHAAAVYNFGVCVARQAPADDPARLRAAINAFRRCIELDPSPELVADARANVETLKLLWAKSRAAEQPPRADEPVSQPPEPGKNADDPGSPGKSGDEKAKKDRIVEAPTDPKGKAVDQKSPFTKAGRMPVVIDPEDPRPIAAADVAQLLGEAQERIRRERRAIRRAAGAGAARPNDW